MHFSILVSIALGIATTSVSAGGTLGYALGSKKPGMHMLDLALWPLNLTIILQTARVRRPRITRQILRLLKSLSSEPIHQMSVIRR